MERLQLTEPRGQRAPLGLGERHPILHVREGPYQPPIPGKSASTVLYGRGQGLEPWSCGTRGLWDTTGAPKIDLLVTFQIAPLGTAEIPFSTERNANILAPCGAFLRFSQATQMPGYSAPTPASRCAHCRATAKDGDHLSTSHTAPGTLACTRCSMSFTAPKLTCLVCVDLKKKSTHSSVRQLVMMGILCSGSPAVTDSSLFISDLPTSTKHLRVLWLVCVCGGQTAPGRAAFESTVPNPQCQRLE